MNTVWPLWTIGIPFVFLLGLVLALWIARRTRRRVDDHPVCRACGFDLFGLPAASTRCPECGTDTTAPRAIVDGNRVTSVKIKSFAWAAMVLCLIASIVSSRLVYQRIDKQAAKPDWWLVWESRSNNMLLHTAALTTLLERAKDGSLSDNSLAAMEAVLLDGFANRAFGTVDAEQWLYDRIVKDPRATRERKDAYTRAIIGDEPLTLRSHVGDGEGLPFHLRVGTGRLPRTVGHHVGDLPFFIRSRDETLTYRIDGGAPRTLRVHMNGFATPGVSMTSTEIVPAEELTELAPGEHMIEIAITWGMRSLEPADKWGEFPKPERSKPFGEMTYRARGTFQRLPPGTSSIKLTPERSQRTTLERLLGSTTVKRVPGGSMQLFVTAKSALPVAVAFDVSLRQGGHVSRVGSYFYATKGRTPLGMGYVFPHTAQPGPAEIVLTSSPLVAARTIDLLEIWDGTIVIPITIPETNPSATGSTTGPSTQAVGE